VTLSGCFAFARAFEVFVFFFAVPCSGGLHGLDELAVAFIVSLQLAAALHHSTNHDHISVI